MAAYEADYHELGTWLILQYQSNPQLSRRQEVSPMLRLMYRNMLLETRRSLGEGGKKGYL